MKWSSWRPEFCTNLKCLNATDPKGDWTVSFGSFDTLHSGPVPRRRCKACGKAMSRSTFEIEFRTKRRLDLQRIEADINGGTGVRTIARSLGLRPETVINRINRLSRQAIGLQVTARARKLGESVDTALVCDGLETFVESQFFPTSLTILVGDRSQFCHVVDHSVGRRRGRMKKEQKAERDRIDATCTFPPRSLAQSCDRVFSHALSLAKGEAGIDTIRTDEHPEYVRCLKRLQKDNVRKINHLTTNSKAPRTVHNPLMAVNYFDREIRKDCANHTRETLQWSKEANNCMDRMYLFMVAHNFLKPWRIRNRKEADICHAEKAGIDRELCKMAREKLFGTRVFLSRIEASMLPSEKMTWLREWPNPHRSKDGVESPPQKVWPYLRA